MFLRLSLLYDMTLREKTGGKLTIMDITTIKPEVLPITFLPADSSTELHNSLDSNSNVVKEDAILDLDIK